MAAEDYECIRCGRTSPSPFTGHRPPADSPRAGLRSCGGTVVRASEVATTRAAEKARLAAVMARVAAAESSWRPH